MASSPWMGRGLLLLLVVGAVAGALWQARSLDVAGLIAWVEGLGALGWLAFIALYALATVLFIPGSVLTLAGGSLFGPLLGTLVNLTGATLGALLAFLLSRHLASDWVERKSGKRLKQLQQGVEQEGWRFVALVRLVPLFPFNLLNYALGLTRIRLSHYLLATYVCMFPGALAYSYLGYAGREAAAGGEGLIQKGLLALALLAAVAFLPRLIARLREGPRLSIGELHQRLHQADPPLVLDVRSAADYQGELGHLAGSINLPLEELEGRLAELTPYLEQPIAVICTTDRRSAKAARLLAGHGFGQVQLVSGGMSEWHREGLPLERGPLGADPPS